MSQEEKRSARCRAAGVITKTNCKCESEGSRLGCKPVCFGAETTGQPAGLGADLLPTYTLSSLAASSDGATKTDLKA